MEERPLEGGRVTSGVVRVGDTFRRPPGPISPFVRELLGHLYERGFNAAPRHLGRDEQGREIFSFIPGSVPPNLDPGFPDETLTAAARITRRFHDATAGTGLSAGESVVCHNDLSPCNFVFRGGEPVAIIDFDAAAPGARLRDVGYALFLWLNLGVDGAPVPEQARRIEVFCGAYGVEADEETVEAVIEAVAANLEQLRAAGRSGDVEWWGDQLIWLRRNRSALVSLLHT